MYIYLLNINLIYIHIYLIYIYLLVSPFFTDYYINSHRPKLDQLIYRKISSFVHFVHFSKYIRSDWTIADKIIRLCTREGAIAIRGERERRKNDRCYISNIHQPTNFTFCAPQNRPRQSFTHERIAKRDISARYTRVY